MSLPTSETKPDGFGQPPRRQMRRSRTSLNQATDSQLNDFLQELAFRTNLDLDYFILLLLSGAVLFLALVLNSPLLLFIAALVAPFAASLAGTALAPALPSVDHFIRSLLATLVTAAGYFVVGWLAGMFPAASNQLPTLHTIHLLRSTWMEWLALVIASGVLAWHFVHADERPRLSSALVSYLVYFPAAMSGLLIQTLASEAWLAALLIAAARLMVTLIVMLIVIAIAGLLPRRVTGWVIAGLLLVALVVSMIYYANSAFEVKPYQPTPAQPAVLPTLPPAEATPSPQPTSTQLATATPRPSPSATLAPTPTPRVAIVSSASGLIIREAAGPGSAVITYADYRQELFLLGEQERIGEVVWEKVATVDGETGWVVAAYLQMATPPAP